jgi:esterase/lipase superfamily enzyme
MRWLITNRNIESGGFGSKQGKLTYWMLRQPGLPLDQFSSWNKVQAKEFRDALRDAADKFPHPAQVEPENQKHVCLFIHGYNNNWTSAMGTYGSVASRLFNDESADSLGELISFDWPSKGELWGYLPDREEARQTADDLAGVLSDLYDWMLVKQQVAQKSPDQACKAKTSVIAHSMGNYALQNAMNAAWTRKNRPLLVSLLHEVLMIAADVDNDLFGSGETVSHGDGEGLANLSYRITALYTGRDNVLGTSAGLKHFGKRRLGRSGLDRTLPLPDNVWDIDCSSLLDVGVSGINIHGEYFQTVEEKIYALMRAVLVGTDRGVLIANGTVPSSAPLQQPRVLA